MNHFTVSPAARQDLADIRDYLVQQASRKVAARVLRELREGMRRVAEMPGIGHLREDLGGGAMRFYRIYKYLIIYRSERQPIGVVRILHGARDVARILEGYR